MLYQALIYFCSFSYYSLLNFLFYIPINSFNDIFKALDIFITVFNLGLFSFPVAISEIVPTDTPVILDNSLIVIPFVFISLFKFSLKFNTFLLFIHFNEIYGIIFLQKIYKKSIKERRFSNVSI
nr:MAG TPA: hypothetical protein [Caudoviricetes sp.]